MAQSFSQNSELDRMKADAIKRARQMHLRAVNFEPNATETNQKEKVNPSRSKPQATPFSRKGILEMIRVLGFENDQLILIALILMLSADEENFPLILALLYIAL